MTFNDQYILDENNNPIPEPDIDKWAKWVTQNRSKRRVAYTEISKDINVSTDHNFSSSNEPLLYETMVFGGKLDMECERYSTREQAIIGHNKMVLEVKESLK